LDNLEEAPQQIESGLAFAAATGEGLSLAELHRPRGEVVLRLDERCSPKGARESRSVESLPRYHVLEETEALRIERFRGFHVFGSQQRWWESVGVFVEARERVGGRFSLR
jgi:hypothetical protein